MILYISILNSIALAFLTKSNELKKTSKRLIYLLSAIQIGVIGLYLWSYYNNYPIAWIYDPFPWLLVD